MATTPRGFQRVAPGATLAQVIATVNSNFQQLFSFLEQKLGGKDALDRTNPGSSFTLNDRANPTIKTNTSNNPNDDISSLPRDKVQFVERERVTEDVTETVTLTDSNDEENSYAMTKKRITKLVMADKVTGAEWIWELGPVTDVLGEDTDVDDDGGGTRIIGTGHSAYSPYFNNPDVYATPQSTSALLTTATLVAGTTYFVPVLLPFDRHITSMACSFGAGTPPVGSSVRMGIFQCDPDTGGPGQVAADAGPLALAATSGPKFATVDVELEGGMYWLAICADVNMTVRSLNTGGGLANAGWNLGVAAGSPGGWSGLSRPTTFTDFADETAQTHSLNGTAPLIGIR